jgi:cytochrome c oxidase assembly factor CtaG
MTGHASTHAPTRARRRRPWGPASGGLLLLGSLVLLGTGAVLLIEVARHFAGSHGPVLPTSWCRSTTMAILPPLSGARWFTSWQSDRVAWFAVAGLAAVYLSGVAAVSRQRRQRWPLLRTASFLGGLLVIVVATSSSIAVYDMAMFSAHMLGHLALVMVAPPLLVAGRPMTLALHATRNPWHGRIRRVVRSRTLALWFCPPVALAAYAVVIVGTHLTGLMNVIMSHPWAGQVEHLAYLLVGYQFFALVIGEEPLRWRLSMPAKELLLAVAMAVDTFTGVILLQTTQAIQMSGGTPSHIDPLDETHLGGAIMWVGGDAIMAVIMMIVAASWLRRPEYRKRSSRSWLEQARRANLDSHTPSAENVPALAGSRSRTTVAAPVRDVDSDDRALSDYNAWLARLAGTGHPKPGLPPSNAGG